MRGGKKSAIAIPLPQAVKRLERGSGKAAPVRNIRNPSGKFAITKACETVFEKHATIKPMPMIDKLVIAATTKASHSGP